MSLPRLLPRHFLDDATKSIGIKMADRNERVYVLEAGGTPLVAFEAASRREADSLRKESWFTEELASLRSAGRPIWDGSALIVRAGAEDEISRYRDGAQAAKESDELILVYLVPLD